MTSVHDIINKLAFSGYQVFHGVSYLNQLDLGTTQRFREFWGLEDHFPSAEELARLFIESDIWIRRIENNSGEILWEE